MGLDDDTHPRSADDGRGAALHSPAGRWILAVTVGAAGMAFLDSTVVNVALPAIGEDLGAPSDVLQWVVTGYLLALASLILVSGSLSDRFGRRRVLVWGAVVFTGASVLCAAAPTSGVLIVARVVQGVGAALLTPGALASIQATIAREDRGRAIGSWSGMTGIASAVGPVVGGLLISSVSWRAIFVLNVPIGAFVVIGARRHLPETKGDAASSRTDVAGATLAVLALAAGTFALTTNGAAPSIRVATGALAVAAAVAFIAVEARVDQPMLPMALFRIRLFSASNAITFIVYGALGGFFFLFASYLQIALGYSPILAGAASLPITLLMLALSPRSGALAARIGPRLPLTLGPLAIGVGLALLALTAPAGRYVTEVLPGIVIVALGLVALVAPITTTVLGAAGESRAGIASGINNAVARLGTLVAVAVVPSLAGLDGQAFYDPAAMADGFRTAMVVCAALSAVGALVALLTIRRPPAEPAGRPSPPPLDLLTCPTAAPPSGVVVALHGDGGESRP